MPKYAITGDLLRSVTVVVVADNLELALEEADAGLFTVMDYHDQKFTFDGSEEDHVRVLPEDGQL